MNLNSILYNLKIHPLGLVLELLLCILYTADLTEISFTL